MLGRSGASLRNFYVCDFWRNLLGVGKNLSFRGVLILFFYLDGIFGCLGDWFFRDFGAVY